MDHKNKKNLNIISSEIDLKKKKTKIIAVSKTFPLNSILPLVNYGHIHYGENKVQEAVQKWGPIKNNYKHVKLHLIGKLQTNKVKFVLPLFDYIHSLDSLKLAEKISIEQSQKKFKPFIFIQVNIGREIQKGGVDIENLEEFVKYFGYQYRVLNNDEIMYLLLYICCVSRPKFHRKWTNQFVTALFQSPSDGKHVPYLSRFVEILKMH